MDLRPLLGVLAGLIALWAALLLLFWILRPRGVPVAEIVKVVPDVLRLLRALLADPAVPFDVKAVLIGLLAWIVSPIDLIPEFIPLLGPLDDVLVAVVAMRFVRRRLGAGALRARWPGTPDGFRVLLRVMGDDRRTG